ncbi:MAG: hypothetical protein QOJ17_1206 [Rhodospirillaceae bacterium]|jgi:hypothetical protein|nr:hypothetical protein [Rhodospirillaceae bacterium]
MVRDLRRKTGKLVELRSLNPHREDGVLLFEDVDFVSRTVQPSQQAAARPACLGGRAHAITQPR